MLQPRIPPTNGRLPPSLYYLFLVLATYTCTVSAQSPSPPHSPLSTPLAAAAHTSTVAPAAAAAASAFPSNGPPPPNDGDGDGDNGHNDGILNFYFLILIGVALAVFIIYWTVVRRRRQNLAKSRLTQHDALAQDVHSWSGTTPSGRSGGGWLGWTSFSSSASTAFPRPTADSTTPGVYFDGQQHEGGGGLRYGFFNWRSRAGSLGVRPWDVGNEEHNVPLPPPPYMKEPENVHMTVLTSSTVSLDGACHDGEANPTRTGSETRHRLHGTCGSGSIISGRGSRSASGTDTSPANAETQIDAAQTPAFRSIEPAQTAASQAAGRRRWSVASHSSLAAAVAAAGTSTAEVSTPPSESRASARVGGSAQGQPLEYTPRSSE